MKKIEGIYYRTSAVLRNRKIQQFPSAKKYANSLNVYAGHRMLAVDESNQKLFDLIDSDEPFLAGRFGSTELLNMRSFDFGEFIGSKYGNDYHFNQLCEWSGFFPNNISLLPKFVDLMKDACRNVDMLAVWFHPFEDYYIKHLMKKDLDVTYLLDFEPWAGNVHWSAALEGKKVLIIHPFEQTIIEQYKKRELIFPGTDILPEFELQTLKAVQTLAGTKDDRFETWFDALQYMYNESMKKDFDIAIIGCGAYGLPLAAKLKQAGKQAIHLAGATQLMLGIKGKRWEDDLAFDYVKKQFNEEWTYPNEEDKVTNSNNVEDGCYWK